MQNDINTQGHTQWFFFRVANTKAKSVIKFNILNFVNILLKEFCISLKEILCLIME